MIYDTKKRLLLNGRESIEISKKNEKLIIALSSMELVRYEEIAKYIYNTNLDKAYRKICMLKKRLQEKTGLKIKTKLSVGYILETDIFFK
jgi:3-deoxy-D-manno-octulosonic acid (KDO) 8-phosphate synthase